MGTKPGSTVVNAQTNINTMSSGILSIADAVRLGKMHPDGPKRVKITIGGWSDYARIGSAENGVKAANLMAKLVQYTFADGLDMDLEHLTPFSGMDDEYGGLIAFITQLRKQFTVVSANWAKTATARAASLQKQYKAACPSYKHCTPYMKKWWQTNINHMRDVATQPAPHLEISWTTRFNAFVPADDVWNYLLPDSAQPTNSTNPFATDNEGLNFWPQTAHLINTGFEPGNQADHGKWEGEAMDDAVAKGIAQNHNGGGVAVWAINPVPSKINNKSTLCANAAKALNQIIQPTYAFGTAPNFTKANAASGFWPPG